jgi:hypothetical protein
MVLNIGLKGLKCCARMSTITTTIAAKQTMSTKKTSSSNNMHRNSKNNNITTCFSGIRAFFTGRLDDPGSNIVPFNVAEATILHDKLLSEIPADEEPRTPPPMSLRRLRRDEIILQKRRLKDARANQKGPKVWEWLELQDPETGKTYYHNKLTMKSSWTPPEGFEDAFEITNLAGELALDGGVYWIELTDSRGRIFYYDLINRESTWLKPLFFDHGAKIVLHEGGDAS